MQKKLLYIILLMFVQTLFAYPHTVRVGFFHMDGYHEIDAQGNKKGYGYDFLQMVSRHSNLNFEYVGYGWSLEEAFEKLRNNEIDLVTSVRKNKERENYFDFSQPIGRTCGKLNIKNTTERIKANDFRTYNGMIVGLMNRNARNADLETFAKENGFTYKRKYYESLDSLENALDHGAVDAVMTSALRRSNDEVNLNEFAFDNFYAVVGKGNKNLLEEIDYAIAQMNNTYASWKDSLYNVHYEERSVKDLVFSGREQDYINRHSAKDLPIKALVRDDRAPYIFVNGGKVKGILADIFVEIMGLNGMDFEFIVAKGREEYNRIISEKGMDIVLDKIGFDEDSLNWVMSPPYFNMPVSSVYKKGFHGEIKTVALVKTFTSLNPKSDSLKVRVIYCDSPEDAVKQVLDGKVDVAYMFRYVAENAVNADISSRLAIGDISWLARNVYIGALSEDDHVLISILSKCIRVLPKNRVNEVVAKYASFSAQTISATQYLRAHPMIVFLAVLTLILLIVVVVIAIMYAHSKSKLLARERKEQLKLRKAQAIADAANTAKSKFLFNISHDIRTPMNSIMGYARKIEKNPGDVEIVKSSIQKINVSSGYMHDLVNDILDMAGIEMGRLKLEEEMMDLNLCVEDLCSILVPSVNTKNISFVRDFAGIRNKYVMIDPQRIRQVLANIISNSVKFTPAGGMIVFSVREFDSRKPGCASYSFTVKDSGIGMSREFKEHIFEEFSREQSAVENKVGGVGLGMAIVKHLVDLMGGDIEVLSEKGKGTTVSLCLDLRIASEESIKSHQKRLKVGKVDWAIKGRKILLVEDNEFNREIALDVLKDVGLSVDVAENGSLAVDKVVEKGPDYYDCILMDLQMPVMNGHEASRAIRELYPHTRIPIIAISANAFEEDRQESMAAGMDDHLAKPIDATLLYETIKRLIQPKKQA